MNVNYITCLMCRVSCVGEPEWKLCTECYEKFKLHVSPLLPPEKKSAGLKFDSNKPPMELLSPVWLEGVAQVLAFGAKKYAAHNWRKGIQISRLIGAALRHIFAFLAGQDLDPESKLPHLHHASCCLMFASELMYTKPECDDRYIQAREDDIEKKIKEAGV